MASSRKRKPRPATKPTRRAPVAARTRSHPLDLAVVALAIAGIALTAYLSYTAWFAGEALYCTEGSGCDLVQESRWSVLLGVPMATWGLLTYVALAILGWRRLERTSSFKPAFTVAVIAFAISSYLTFISFTEIEALCPWCLASYAIVTAVVVLLALRKPREGTFYAWGKVLAAPLAGAVLVVAGLQMHYSGLFDPAAGPERPRLQALARHLDTTGAKFYGAYWCPRCQQQKALFEASIARVPYVECSPNGRNGGIAAACAVKQIREYPTWIIGGKRFTGVIGLEQLEALSGFRFDG